MNKNKEVKSIRVDMLFEMYDYMEGMKHRNQLIEDMINALSANQNGDYKSSNFSVDWGHVEFSNISDIAKAEMSIANVFETLDLWHIFNGMDSKNSN